MQLSCRYRYSGDHRTLHEQSRQQLLPTHGADISHNEVVNYPSAALPARVSTIQAMASSPIAVNVCANASSATYAGLHSPGDSMPPGVNAAHLAKLDGAGSSGDQRGDSAIQGGRDSSCPQTSQPRQVVFVSGSEQGTPSDKPLLPSISRQQFRHELSNYNMDLFTSSGLCNNILNIHKAIVAWKYQPRE